MELEEQQHVRHRDEAVELIECYMQREGLGPHAKLPGEREMCEMWDVNRTTLRAAIRRLIDQGRLYSMKGSGTYVAAPKLERNLQDIKSTTESVHSAGRKLRTRVLETEVVEASHYVAEKLQIREGDRVFFLRRLRIMDGVPYMLETSYIPLDRCPRLLDYDFSEESLYRVLRYHQIYPVQGSESVGITYATDAEARYLQLEAGDALFFLTGVTQDQSQVPIEYFKSVARHDKVYFSSILRKANPKGDDSHETGSSRL